MSEVFEKEAKPKRKLTQKQLDALAKGRAKAAERRKQKKLNDNLEKEAVKTKKEQRSVAKNKLKEQNLLEQVMIREKEEKKRAEIVARQERWIGARLHALSKCKTKAQFDEVEKLLDTVEFDDFKESDFIEKRFQKYIGNKNE